MKTVRRFTKTGQVARGQREQEHVITTKNTGRIAISALGGRLSINFRAEDGSEWSQHFGWAETRQIAQALKGVASPYQ